MNEQQNVIGQVLDEIGQFLSQSNALRSLILLALSIIAAFFLSKIVGWLILKIADRVSVSSEAASSTSRAIQLRRVETYLSVTVALVRAVIVGFVAFFVWQAVSPAANLSAAAIGAGAFFIVIASGTMGMILRDITAGAAMIAGRWFNVGDFVQIEPFLNVSGVVEEMTLRSTKLRNIDGEVIWIHNQHIQAAKVTQGGVRTIAVDIFARNGKTGRALIEKVVSNMPVSPMTIAQKLKITREEQWSKELWVLTVTGETVPGREWLIEDYFVDSLTGFDSKKQAEKVLVRPPIVRRADPQAERSFRRAMLPKNHTATTL